ncbi:unnamed protein product [Meganyctiphanes norvegica]|uniref:C2H2-type domain-containing protein n=1 Tax=Meganyctiphanes norvegica TaxID=48144 RepID=A0AAV2RLZ9_MEGNR
MDFSIADEDIDATIMKMKVDYAESNHSDPEEPSEEEESDGDDPFDVYAYVETHMMNEFSECESDTNDEGAEEGSGATPKSSKQRFECMECDEVFDTRDDLIKHIDTHFNSDVFSTDVANERYKKKRENNNGSELMKNFRCKLCSYRCTNKKRLKDHTAVHSDEKPFSCSQCKFKTKHNLSLLKHIENRHSGKKAQSIVPGDIKRKPQKSKHKTESLSNGQNFACIEADCNFVTKNVNEITAHMDTHDELQPDDAEKSPEQSEDEDWESEEEEYLKAQTKMRKNSKLYVCKFPNCGYRVTRKDSFQIHSIRHTGAKPEQCPYCEYRCVSRSTLGKHLATHSDRKPFKCTMCDYRCALKDGLNKHTRSHTKPFKCLLCDFRCAERPYLNQHMLKHTGEKPFACERCDFRCVSADLLRSHIRVHSTEKPFACDYCSYATNRKQELTRHVERIHIKDKQHTCEFCPYATSQRRELNRHVERIHSEFKPAAAQRRPQAPRQPRGPRQPRAPRPPPKMESNIVVSQEAVLPQPASFAPVNVGPMPMPPPMLQMPHMSFGGYQFPHNEHGHFYGHN